MLALKVFRGKEKGLADLLNYAALVDEGVVLGKDGSLLAGYYYRGPDVESSTPGERNHLTDRVNAALARLGDGWATWTDAVRMPAATYPARERSAFADPISRLIDEERREQFMEEGAHFECEHVMVVQYLPPLRLNAMVGELVYSEEAEAGAETLGGRIVAFFKRLLGAKARKNVERATPLRSASKESKPADRILKFFKQNLSELEDTLSGSLKLRRMGALTYDDQFGRPHMQDELVNYLHFCVSGQAEGINIPPAAMYLDAILGGVEAWPGEQLKVAGQFVTCLGIEGFPGESYPGMLAVLDYLPVAYRWSSRFIFLDAVSADKELHKYRRKWRQKMRGFVAQVFRTQNGVVDQDAALMAAQAEAAISDAKSNLVAFGYYTPVVVLSHEDPEQLREAARTVSREVQRLGFACRIETVNTMEAWLGSLPGHAVPNVRRPLIHSLNLADLLPLASVWPGRDTCPCPFYPEDSPPLMHAATAGATPFRLNLHVSDVGHTIVIGPTGAGKSTALGMFAAQHRRYPGSTVWAFDKGRSLLPLTLAVGGQHYDINGDGVKLSFCPLQRLEDPSDIAWAEEWLAACYQLQAEERPSPEQGREIHRAIVLMAAPNKADQRSLSDFCATVQDEKIRAALQHYTLDGSMGHLLDSREDGLRDNTFQVFELEELMPLGDRNVIPVLLYLFRRFSQALSGQPALLSLDEAWLLLAHPVFKSKIVEWLKVLRKANCAVIMATQSLADATKSGIMDVLMESCPTKILLPNEEADKPGAEGYAGPRDLYMSLGLNETQIDLIKNATKKRHYYYLSTEGRRVFELGLGPVALAFTGASDKESLAEVKRLHEEHGAEWPYKWLEARRVNYARLLG